ncbi:FMN-binding protein MioC [Thorsellia kenyensis]|uniref:FMN-binding protein MioC n=1 Tax=Thorsellia kenyensis TaxID=1549888 RepID=A0ABV6CAT9_9GAMM
MSTPITLITGSSLGNAEYVAESLEPFLANSGFNPEIKHGPELAEVPKVGFWLIICSTHGAGDVPDNLLPWINDIIDSSPELSQVKFGVIGLGSSDYDLFCGAIDTIIQELLRCGATKIGETLKIDALDDRLPEEIAQAWIEEWIDIAQSN